MLFYTGSIIKPLTNLSMTDHSIPEKASAEFGLVLIKILKELKQNETDNLENLQIISSTLTVKDSSGVRMFNDGELEAIQSCTNIKTLLVQKLRHCYRWDDYSMLTALLSSIDAKESLRLLQLFEIKTYSQIKLHQIQAQLSHEFSELPKGYEKMIAIIDKIFLDITKKEYDDLKQFIADHCGVEPYVISPFLKASPFNSIAIEWLVPVTAVSYMIETAKTSSHNFSKEIFVYLKISSTVIFDHKDNVSFSV